MISATAICCLILAVRLVLTRNLSSRTGLRYGVYNRGKVIRLLVGKQLYIFSTVLKRLWGAHNFLLLASRALFPEKEGKGGQCDRAVKLALHIHLMTRLENEWSYTSSPPFALLACIGTILTLILSDLIVFFLVARQPLPPPPSGPEPPHSRGF